MATKTPQNLQRCTWPKTDLSIAYHDAEWGVPSHDDQHLFEALVLGGAQAGLSWETVLRKRERYRQVFDRFDPQKVARYRAAKVEKLLKDAGIIRNRMKIESAIANAKAVLKVQDELGSFDVYLWQFVDGRPVVNRWRRMKQLPARTPQSDAMSKDLRARGFKFAGTTICYAVMQAVGMVNDHLVTCYRHGELSKS